MNFTVDTHTHTVASGHAYSTIEEMARAAKQQGLELLCITEHAMAMPGTCHEFYFENTPVIPRFQEGIQLMFGTEANIIDYEGHLDMSEPTLKKMDLVIASLHGPCIEDGTKEQNTAAIIGAMNNPYVNIIGHPDDGRYELDYEAIVLEAKKTNTLIELNNSSLNPKGFRKNTRPNALTYLELCKKHHVYISLGSDAHVNYDVANFTRVKQLLEEINFPEELIVNTSKEKFLSFLSKKRK